jgi:NADPH-dependent F420 reductase
MIGFIGGTGPEGRGLALRFAMAGEKVLIGSRDAGRAKEAAESLANAGTVGSVEGKANEDVAQESDIVFIAVPYTAQRPTLEGLKTHLDGKLIVNVIAPLAFEKGRASAVRVDAGSAAEEAKEILPASQMVAAFHNISAQELLVPELSLETDVIVCSDDVEAKQKVMALAETISGVRAVDGGGLVNARYTEDLTALLLNINRIYKAHSMIKIVGI